MDSSQITCLGVNISSNLYPDSSHKYLSSFPSFISIDELRAETDEAWSDCLRKHGGKLTDAFFAEYYTHPVWCLNSVFSGVDPASVHNRESLIKAIASLRVKIVADMGGGYGVFLQMLKQICPDLKAILCEPYLDKQIESALAEKKIDVTRQVPAEADVYVFIDVLEHLVEPLMYLQKVLQVAKRNSYFIFGNCFYPVIKCHLPSTFYLRHTFPFAVRLMGLRHICNAEGAEYMQIYRFESNPALNPRIVMILARAMSILLYLYSLAFPRIIIILGNARSTLLYMYSLPVRVARKLKRVARKLFGGV